MLIAQFDDIKKAYEYAKNHELQTGIKTKVICLAENAQIFDVVVDCDIEKEPLTTERALNVIQELLQEIEQYKQKLEKIKEIENNRNLTINKRREEINKIIESEE